MANVAIMKQNDEGSEEGEIVDSEEEINVLERIKELEAQNDELEKIAAISAIGNDKFHQLKAYSCSNNSGVIDEKKLKFSLYSDISSSSSSEDENLYNKNVCEKSNKHKHKTHKRHKMKDAHRQSRNKIRHCLNHRHRRKSKTKNHKAKNVSFTEKPHNRNQNQYNNYHNNHNHHMHYQPQQQHQGHFDDYFDIISIESDTKNSNSPDKQLCYDEEEDDATSLYLNREELRLALAHENKRDTPKLLEHRLLGHSHQNDGSDVKESYNEEQISVKNDGIITIPDEDDVGNDSNSDTLEEQELRLIALKSAVMNKHNARKKRNAESAYSPTDFEQVLADNVINSNADDEDDDDNMDIVDQELNGWMDLSPRSSSEDSESSDIAYLIDSNSHSNYIVDTKAIDMDIADSCSENEGNISINNFNIMPVNAPQTSIQHGISAMYLMENTFQSILSGKTQPPPPPPPPPPLPPLSMDVDFSADLDLIEYQSFDNYQNLQNPENPQNEKNAQNYSAYCQNLLKYDKNCQLVNKGNYENSLSNDFNSQISKSIIIEDDTDGDDDGDDSGDDLTDCRQSNTTDNPGNYLDKADGDESDEELKALRAFLLSNSKSKPKKNVLLESKDAEVTNVDSMSTVKDNFSMNLQSNNEGVLQRALKRLLATSQNSENDPVLNISTLQGTARPKPVKPFSLQNSSENNGEGLKTKTTMSALSSSSKNHDNILKAKAISLNSSKNNKNSYSLKDEYARREINCFNTLPPNSHNPENCEMKLNNNISRIRQAFVNNDNIYQTPVNSDRGQVDGIHIKSMEQNTIKGNVASHRSPKIIVNENEWCDITNDFRDENFIQNSLLPTKLSEHNKTVAIIVRCNTPKNLITIEKGFQSKRCEQPDVRENTTDDHLSLDANAVNIPPQERIKNIDTIEGDGGDGYVQITSPSVSTIPIDKDTDHLRRNTTEGTELVPLQIINQIEKERVHDALVLSSSTSTSLQALGMVSSSSLPSASETGERPRPTLSANSCGTVLPQSPCSPSVTTVPATSPVPLVNALSKQSEKNDSLPAKSQDINIDSKSPVVSNTANARTQPTQPAFDIKKSSSTNAEEDIKNSESITETNIKNSNHSTPSQSSQKTSVPLVSTNNNLKPKVSSTQALQKLPSETGSSSKIVVTEVGKLAGPVKSNASATNTLSRNYTKNSAVALVPKATLETTNAPTRASLLANAMSFKSAFSTNTTLLDRGNTMKIVKQNKVINKRLSLKRKNSDTQISNVASTASIVLVNEINKKQTQMPMPTSTAVAVAATAAATRISNSPTLMGASNKSDPLPKIAVKKLIISLHASETETSDEDFSSSKVLGEPVKTNDCAVKKPVNLGFEKKLDDFLKNMRSKADQKISNATGGTQTKRLASAPAQPKRIETTQHTTSPPSSVRHLSIAAQEEYKRLTNRIKLIEKQRKAEQSITILSSQNAKASPAVIDSPEIIKAVQVDSEATEESLKTAETALLKTSSTIVFHLNEQISMVEKAKQAKIAKLTVGHRLENLRAEIKELESKYQMESESISKLHAKMQSTNKLINALQQKKKKVKMAAVNIGKIIVGTEYRLPDASDEQTSNKMKALNNEIKLFNAMTYADINKESESQTRNVIATTSLLSSSPPLVNPNDSNNNTNNNNVGKPTDLNTKIENEQNSLNNGETDANKIDGNNLSKPSTIQQDDSIVEACIPIDSKMSSSLNPIDNDLENNLKDVCDDASVVLSAEKFTDIQGEKTERTLLESDKLDDDVVVLKDVGRVESGSTIECCEKATTMTDNVEGNLDENRCEPDWTQLDGIKHGYSSVLDCFTNYCKRLKSDAIICPFDLTGECIDEKCEFQHFER